MMMTLKQLRKGLGMARPGRGIEKAYVLLSQRYEKMSGMAVESLAGGSSGCVRDEA